MLRPEGVRSARAYRPEGRRPNVTEPEDPVTAALGPRARSRARPDFCSRLAACRRRTPGRYVQPARQCRPHRWPEGRWHVPLPLRGPRPAGGYRLPAFKPFGLSLAHKPWDQGPWAAAVRNPGRREPGIANRILILAHVASPQATWPHDPPDFAGPKPLLHRAAAAMFRRANARTQPPRGRPPSSGNDTFPRPVPSEEGACRFFRGSRTSAIHLRRAARRPDPDRLPLRRRTGPRSATPPPCPKTPRRRRKEPRRTRHRVFRADDPRRRSGLTRRPRETILLRKCRSSKEPPPVSEVTLHLVALRPRGPAASIRALLHMVPIRRSAAHPKEEITSPPVRTGNYHSASTSCPQQ